jgi:hypothetical protein
VVMTGGRQIRYPPERFPVRDHFPAPTFFPLDRRGASSLFRFAAGDVRVPDSIHRTRRRPGASDFGVETRALSF